jgi:flagellar assembly factor FliW
MAECSSKRLGRVEYCEESVVEFPVGLPAFEQERWFVMVEQSETAPVIFLQSLHSEGLCFVTLPVQTVRSGYQVHLGAEEKELLGPARESDLLVLVMVTLPETGEPTINLMAPLVIHRHTRRGCQLIQTGSGYSFAEGLGSGAASCS